MSARWRGWLTVAVAVMLLTAFMVLGNAPPLSQQPADFGDTLVAGRPAPADTTSADSLDLARAGAVRELLASRAEAVLRRSEAEFMATVDPQADPAFLDAQRALFANLHGVPLAHWSYQLNPNGPQPIPESLRDRGEYWAPKTTLRYALAGVDGEPTARPMVYLYVRRGERWYLASDTALAADSQTWRGLWDFGPCQAVPTANGIVLGHTGAGELLAAFASELDAAVADVTEVWGGEWAQRVAVLVPQTVAEMRTLVGPAFNVDGIAAAAVADKVDVANGLAVGQRIVLNPVQADRLSAAARRIVLRHEITHVAARAATVDGAPMWLLEGFADYVGYRNSGLQPREAAPDLVRALRAGDLPATLPANADFVGGSDNLDLAYQLAWSVALYVADRVGEDGLVRFYRQLAGDHSQDQGSADQAMQAVLGVDFSGFVDGWRNSLPARFG